MIMNKIIKHVDGKTNVKAKFLRYSNPPSFEYKFQGMTYSREITLTEAYEFGVIECDCSQVITILGYENSIAGEQCIICGKVDYFGNPFIKPDGSIKSTDLERAF